MNAFVSFQIYLSDKSFIANLTCMRLLPCMSEFVYFQFTLLDKAFIAILTFKRSLPRMNASMSFQIRLIIKSAITTLKPTFQWPVTQMSESVSFQTMTAGKCFTATIE